MFSFLEKNLTSDMHLAEEGLCSLSLSLSREELGTKCVVTLFYNVVDRKRELCP